MKSQQQIVLDQLNLTGEISRNWCLQNYISRLSAIIYDLKAKGYEFKEVRRDTGGRQGDYVYVLIKDPTKLNTEIYKPEVVKQRLHDYHNPKLI